MFRFLLNLFLCHFKEMGDAKDGLTDFSHADD